MNSITHPRPSAPSGASFLDRMLEASRRPQTATAAPAVGTAPSLGSSLNGTPETKPAALVISTAELLPFEVATVRDLWAELGSLAETNPKELVRIARSTLRETKRRKSAPTEDVAITTEAEFILSTKNDPPTRIYPTGFAALDGALGGGLKSAEQAILIGGTGAGKTAKAQNIAIAIARSGTPVVWISSELTRKMNALRLAAIASGGTIDIPSLQFGIGSGEKAYQFLKDLPLYAFSLADQETPSDPVGFIEQRVKDVEKHTGKRPVVILDYLQDLARTDDEKVRMAVGAVSRRFRLMATINDWAVLLVSSTSRANHLRSDKPISFEYVDYQTYAKESGDVEYDAAVLMVLITMPQADPTQPKDCFLMLSKNRGGTNGAIGFTFMGKTGIFTQDDSALDRIKAIGRAAETSKKENRVGATREKIRSAVASGPKSRVAILSVVRGNRKAFHSTINAMIADGDLKQTKDGIGLGDGIPVGVFANSVDPTQTTEREDQES